jgi:hypothetical protein
MISTPVSTNMPALTGFGSVFISVRPAFANASARQAVVKKNLTCYGQPSSPEPRARLNIFQTENATVAIFPRRSIPLATAVDLRTD